MRNQLTLFLLYCVWSINCECRSLSNSINSTEDGNITEIEIKTTNQPIATEMLQAITPDSSSLSSTTYYTVNANEQDEAPRDHWMGRKSSIPIITLSCIVLVLVFVVSVLSVIILVYRKRMHRMKTLITKLPSPTASPTHAAQITFIQDGEDINHNPQPQITVSSVPNADIIPSLKYDQPYAHQKSITDRVRQMIVTPPTSPNIVSTPPPDNDDAYLTPKQITPTPPEFTTISSSPLDDMSLASGESGEYQVPRNAKKRAGLLTRDTSTKEVTSDDEYVVMVGDQPITDDEKAGRSIKRSTKESLKKGANSLKKLPENLASRIKFFQDKMKIDHKEVTPEKDEKPEYDVPRGILK